MGFQPLSARLAFLGAVAASVPAPTLACSSPQELSERVRADLVFDMETGQIIYAQNIDKPAHTASLSKMIAGVLMAQDLQTGALDPKAKITFDVPSYKNFVRVVLPSGRVRVDKPDSVTIKGMMAEAEDILALGITRSGNDAMFSFAKAAAGSEEAFVARVNQMTTQLGMAATYHTNVSGWPTLNALKHQRTTAYDLGIFLRYVASQPDSIQEYFRQPTVTFGKVTYPNTNRLFKDPEMRPSIVASKTGTTCPAGSNVVMIVKVDDHPFGIITLGHNRAFQRDDRVRALVTFAKTYTQTEQNPSVSLPPLNGAHAFIPNPVPAPDLFLTQDILFNSAIFTKNIAPTSIKFNYFSDIFLKPSKKLPAPVPFPVSDKVVLTPRREDFFTLGFAHAL